MPEEKKPFIFCYVKGTERNKKARKRVVAIIWALAEDGTLLVEKKIENMSEAKNEIGVTTPVNDEIFKRHYPKGCQIVWKDPPLQTHKELMVALARNESKKGPEKSLGPKTEDSPAEKPEANEQPPEDPGPYTKEAMHLELPVKYSDEEMAKLGIRIAGILRELSLLESAKKASADRYKGEIAEINEKISEVRRKIEKGTALTTVECEAIKNARGKVVEVFRKDTGEIVEGLQQTRMNLDQEQPESEVADSEADEPDSTPETSQEGAQASETSSDDIKDIEIDLKD